MKSNVKKKLASIRKHESKTGGGPCTTIELTNDDNRIIAIIGKENLDGNILHETGFSLRATSSVGQSTARPNASFSSTAGPSRAEPSTAAPITAGPSYAAWPSSTGTITMPDIFIIDDDATEVKEHAASALITDSLSNQNESIVVDDSSDSESSENCNQKVNVKHTVITRKYFR